MGFRVPFKIHNIAQQSATTYPYAISLLESIYTYDSTNEKVSKRVGVSMLVANYKRNIHDLLTEVFLHSVLVTFFRE